MLVAEDLGYSGKALEMKVCSLPHSHLRSLTYANRFLTIMLLVNSRVLLLLGFKLGREVKQCAEEVGEVLGGGSFLWLSSLTLSI